MNTNLHAVTDSDGRPISFFTFTGPARADSSTVQRFNDYSGAAGLLSSLPAAEWLLADRGYDAAWFREALKNRHGPQPACARYKQPVLLLAA